MTARQDEARLLLSELQRQLEALQQSGVRWLNVPGATVSPGAPAAAAASPPRAAQAASVTPVPSAAPRARTAPDAQSPAGVPLPAGDASVEPARIAARLAADGAPDTPGTPPSPSSLETLESLRSQYRDCRRCKLCDGRTQIVFGVGADRPRILFVGEGPGADEDAQGLPFVGRAGRLLTGLIQAMGLVREDVYITNVVKCRPPGNRNPEPDEVASCRPILQRQIELLDPRLIVTLGNVPLKALNPQAGGITRERGTPFTYQRWQVLPTFHPSYLLRSPSAIETCWQDFRSAMRRAYAEP